MVDGEKLTGRLPMAPNVGSRLSQNISAAKHENNAIAFDTPGMRFLKLILECCLSIFSPCVPGIDLYDLNI